MPLLQFDGIQNLSLHAIMLLSPDHEVFSTLFFFKSWKNAETLVTSVVNPSFLFVLPFLIPLNGTAR